MYLLLLLAQNLPTELQVCPHPQTHRVGVFWGQTPGGLAVSQVKILLSPANKRQRINPSKPCLPIQRLQPPLDDHIHTFSKTRSTCKYCSFLNLRSKQLHPQRAPLKVSNVYQMCVKCNVHLCEVHFQVYHTKNYESSDDEDEVVKNFESV